MSTSASVASRRGGSGRRLGLPLVLLAIEWTAVLLAAQFLYGFSERREAVAPAAIWHPDARAPASGSTSVTLVRTFRVDRPISGAEVWIAALDQARLSIDGQDVVATVAPGAAAQAALPSLSPGLHVATIAAERAGEGGAVVAYLDHPALPGGRLVTDGTWSVGSSAGAGNPGSGARLARVVGAYGEEPLGAAFGEVPAIVRVAQGPEFWWPLLGLLGALAVATLSGPLLWPSRASAVDARPLEVAIVIPSIAYAAAASLIVSLGAAGVAPEAVVGLLVVATAVFLAALVGWRRGADRVADDLDLHHAEIAGYDAMQSRIGMIHAAVESQADEVQRALARPLAQLVDAARSASTSRGTPDLDARIDEILRAIESDVGAGTASDRIEGRVREALGLIRRREAAGQSSRGR